MFTGIITETGKVKSKIGSVLTVYAPKTAEDLKPGDSVCVNGVCLTVTREDSARTLGKGQGEPVFKVDLLEETLKRTNLGKLRTGDILNLELALKAGDRISGHIVTGHVDGICRLVHSYRKGNDRVLEVEAPYSIAKYLVSKGSISIDGVSLTIVRVTGNRFTVHLIPYTLKYTTLGNKRVGSMLNIEVDVLAKYAGVSR